MPLWLAVSLAQRELVELQSPKFMSKAYYAQLKAGPDVVTMRSMSPYIYEATVKLCENMNEEQAKEAIELYQGVFVERFAKLIIDHSNQTMEGLAQSEDFSSVVAKKLTNIEREIFDIHRRQKSKFTTWKNRDGPQIEMNAEFATMANVQAEAARQSTVEEAKGQKRFKMK